MGGEFPPRSLTVLTAAHWSNIASSLKHDTPPAVQAGVWSCRAHGACKCVCQTQRQRDVRGGRRGWWASFTQLCHTFRLSVYHVCVIHWEVLSSTLCACVWELSPLLSLCAEQLLHQPEDRCTQTVDILPIHRQISLLNQMMVVVTQLTITVSLQGSWERNLCLFFSVLAPYSHSDGTVDWKRHFSHLSVTWVQVTSLKSIQLYLLSWIPFAEFWLSLYYNLLHICSINDRKQLKKCLMQLCRNYIQVLRRFSCILLYLLTFYCTVDSKYF